VFSCAYYMRANPIIQYCRENETKCI